MASPIQNLAELKPITLDKFTPLPMCPKCGNMPKPPLFPAWFVRWFSMRCAGIGIHYCNGSKDATSTVRHLFGEFEVVNNCAGFSQEHLHVHCPMCHYTWLMAVKR